VGAINGYLARLLPAGFYYKTFKWPTWHLFEPTIRRMAGFGRVSGERDPDRYEEVARRWTSSVAGGGIAGLSAAVAAAQGGANTMLLASSPLLGRRLGWRGDTQLSQLIADARTCRCAHTHADPGLRCVRPQSAVRARNPGAGGLTDVARPAVCCASVCGKIRARHIVSAAGAFERPMLFPNNDRPGVMLAGAADKYAHAFGVACGQRVVIAANSDSAYPWPLPCAAPASM
jgi:sarcosine oxidase subunit alpha